MPAWLTYSTPPIMPRKPARGSRTAPSQQELFAALHARQDPRAAREAVTGAYLAEVDARRCVICGSKGPAWGYGPPLVPRQVWACFEHRHQADPRSPEAIPEWLR